MGDKSSPVIILLLVTVVSLTTINKEEFRDKNIELKEDLDSNEIIKEQLLEKLDKLLTDDKLNKEEIEGLNNTIMDLRKENMELKRRFQTPTRGNRGSNFKATAYCGCSICNGKWVGQPTASGTPMVEGKTIAVDPDFIPLGSTVYIDGLGERTAEDTGNAIKGKIVDIYFDSHQKALEFGRRDIYLEIR